MRKGNLLYVLYPLASGKILADSFNFKTYIMKYIGL